MARVIYFFFASLLIINFLNFASSLEAEQILRGEKVKPGTFKFTCALTYLGRLVGTCFIIDDKWIGTAAHSVTRIDTAAINIFPWKVVAGFTDMRNMRSGIQAEVAAITIHKDYKTPRRDLDFALLELRTSLEVDKNNLKRLRLPVLNDPIYAKALNTEVPIAGFGWDYAEVTIDPKTNKKTLSGKHVSKTLNTIKVNLFESNTECCNMNGVMCSKTEWSENQLTKGICKGDSGSAIEVDGYAIAVVSSGPMLNHARLQQIAKLTKLGPHYQWINDVMNQRNNNDVITKIIPISSSKPEDDKEKEEHYINKRSTNNKSNGKTTPKNKIVSSTPSTKSTYVTSRPIVTTQSTTVKVTQRVVQSSASRTTTPTPIPATLSPSFYMAVQKRLEERDGDSCVPEPFSLC